jgi:SAM-dependent methyltransferase
VRPDVVGDFRALQFLDNTFALVVFDPPHATFGKSSVMAKTYGTLGGEDWHDLLRMGFSECFRVLKPGGVLVFKWCEWEIPVRDVLALTPEKPLFGHISGRRAQTHWVTFMKPNDLINRLAASGQSSDRRERC